ncbi:MAG: Ig-like domain-containing protein, partial [Actinomycetes bacterium]
MGRKNISAISAKRRWAIALGVLAAIFALSWLSGCGQDGESLKCSGDAAAADLGDGQVCADSGFRPSLNDFAFPNWGGVDAGEEDVSASTLIALYGANQVCATGSTAADCVLTPVAEESLNQLTTSLGGGRCEGLAVLSMRYNVGVDDPSSVESSASLTHDLVRPQATLDSQIIKWWATQFAPEVLAKATESRKKDPAKLTAELAKGLANGNGYTIGICGEGLGHAVTPFAVTRREKQYVIHIYDNNYPGERREIIVDRSTRSWSYDGATENPDGTAGTWSGSTGTFEITPMDARVPPFMSPFTSKSESVKGSVKVRLAMNSSPGDPAAGLLVTTASGKRFGIVNGQLVSDVPGGIYTVGKGGLGTSLTEVEIPELEEEYSVQPVAATNEESTLPIEATLSVVSADGTSTSMRAEVSLSVATSTSDVASLGSALKISADAGVTVEARGSVSVVVASNQGKVEADLDAGQSLVMESSTGVSAVKVVAEDGTVASETKLARVDSPPPKEPTPTTTTTRPPDSAPTIGALGLPAVTYGQGEVVTIPTPASNSGGRFSFSSSDTQVATIDQLSGRLSIVGAGQTTITGSQSAAEGFLSGSVSGTLTVRRADPSIGGLEPMNRSLVDGSFAVTSPSSSGDGNSMWSSSDPSVAAIDPTSGVVTPVSVGLTTITFARDQSRNYSGGSVSTTLSVTRAIPSFGGFSVGSRRLVDGAFAAYAPPSTSSGVVSWSSSDLSVATVDPVTGLVTPVSVGSTTITFTRAESPRYASGSTSAVLTVT